MGGSVSKIEYKNIDIHERVGDGGFGFVHRVTFKKAYNGYKVAAAKTVFDVQEEEVKIMSKLHHPNIVTLLGFCQSGHVDIILMEYALNGSLHDYLSDLSKPLPDDLMEKWARESALAIRYLHEHNFLHRDIKPQNCLLFENNLLKLGDFGLAREIDHSQTTSSQKGTFRYMAPEIHRGNGRGKAVYSKPADIYAYGMLILEICTRKPPFDGFEWQAVVFKVANGTQPLIPEDCPKDLSDVMKQCWNTDPKKRPDIEQIVDVVCKWSLAVTIYPEHERKSNSQHTRHARRLACLPNGGLVVAYRNKLYILNNDGSFQMSLNAPTMADRETQIGWVWDIAISAQGHIVVVDDRRYVKVFDDKGTYLPCFSTVAPGEDIINTSDAVMSATIDKEDNILIGDCDNNGNGVITVHSCPDGRLLSKVKYNIVDTKSMVVNSKKQIIYTQSSGSNDTNVVAIDYSGNEIFSFRPRIDESFVTGKVVESGGIACDSRDNIYISLNIRKGLCFDPYTGHVHKYSSTGKFLGCIVNKLYCPLDLIITADNSLVIANRSSILVYRLN